MLVCMQKNSSPRPGNLRKTFGVKRSSIFLNILPTETLVFC